MNARIAIQENERLTRQFVEQVDVVAERRNITKIEAINYLLDVYNNSTLYTDSQKLSYELRANNLMKQLQG